MSFTPGLEIDFQEVGFFTQEYVTTQPSIFYPGFDIEISESDIELITGSYVSQQPGNLFFPGLDIDVFTQTTDLVTGYYIGSTPKIIQYVCKELQSSVVRPQVGDTAIEFSYGEFWNPSGPFGIPIDGSSILYGGFEVVGIGINIDGSSVILYSNENIPGNNLGKDISCQARRPF